MSYSDEVLNYVYDKSGGCCRHCGKKLAWKNYGKIGSRGAWEIDHSNPVSRGGTDYLRNLVPSCIECKRSKGDLTSQEFERYLKKYFDEPNDKTFKFIGKALALGVLSAKLLLKLKEEIDGLKMK